MWRSKAWVWALVGAAVARADLIPVLGGQRVGISALQFLKIGAGARPAALAGAFTAVADDATGLYWNPAGCAVARPGVVASYVDWPVGISHRFVGLVVPWGGQAVGVSLVHLGCPQTPVTTEMQPEGTGETWGFNDVAVALTYARSMTDRFSFGITLRYVDEALDVLHMRAFTFDAGTLYRIGWGSSRFAVVVSNFGPDVAPEGTHTLWDGTPVSSFDSYSPPTEFRLGFATEVVNTPSHRLTLAAQLNHPNDNEENVSLGAEYAAGAGAFLRAGMRVNSDAESACLGAGLVLPWRRTVSADVAYTFMGDLGNVTRVSVGVQF